ncbi:MAG: SpoIIE family protein phosphatase [Bacteroidales bacterium]|nr:SpoIIE family protein phosphatase [Bacteroidales bacterium]
MKKITILNIIITFCFVINGQNITIDSLKNLLETSENDTNKVELLKKLTYEYYDIQDTINIEKYLGEIIFVIDKNKKNYKLDDIEFIKSMYQVLKNFEKTSEYFEKYSEIALKQNKLTEFARNEAYYLYFLSDYGFHQKAIEKGLELLSFVEQNDLKEQFELTYIMIAYAYRNYNLYDQALSYFEKAALNSDTTNPNNFLHISYNEIGNIYKQKNDYKKALEFQQKALEIRLTLGIPAYLMYSYNDIAGTYQSLGEFELALNYYKKSANLVEKSNDYYSYSFICNNIAQIYLLLGQNDSSLIYIKKNEDILKNLNINELYYHLYFVYSSYYQAIGNFEKAFDYINIAYSIKDSIFTEETNQQIANFEKKYEIEKRDNEILKTNEKLKIQKILIYTFIFGILLIGFFMLLIYRQFKQKKLAYTVLQKKNEEILQQKEEILQQKEEIEAQRDLIAEQKNNLTQSINYAFRIQTALFPPKDFINAILPKNFIYYKPKDIVSGDFYWATKIDNKIVLTVADCTGHGVPGAFMSILAISLLNEITLNSSKQNSLSAAFILDKLKQQIIKSLRQKDPLSKSVEGIDMALCIIDENNRKLQYAGAYNSIFINRNNNLIEIKADRMPVGISLKSSNNFKNNIFELQKDDILFLFTDGYSDQFGGSNYEKYSSSRFKKLLLSISADNFDVGFKILDEELLEWIEKKPLNHKQFQIDDILLMGIKF